MPGLPKPGSPSAGAARLCSRTQDNADDAPASSGNRVTSAAEHPGTAHETDDRPHRHYHCADAAISLMAVASPYNPMAQGDGDRRERSPTYWCAGPFALTRPDVRPQNRCYTDRIGRTVVRPHGQFRSNHVARPEGGSPGRCAHAYAFGSCSWCRRHALQRSARHASALAEPFGEGRRCSGGRPFVVALWSSASCPLAEALAQNSITLARRGGASKVRGGCVWLASSVLAACGLTIHSSRTRFAGRLNSSVRRHMRTSLLLVVLTLIALSACASQAT